MSVSFSTGFNHVPQPCAKSKHLTAASSLVFLLQDLHPRPTIQIVIRPSVSDWGWAFVVCHVVCHCQSPKLGYPHWAIPLALEDAVHDRDQNVSTLIPKCKNLKVFQVAWTFSQSVPGKFHWKSSRTYKYYKISVDEVRFFKKNVANMYFLCFFGDQKMSLKFASWDLQLATIHLQIALLGYTIHKHQCP